MENRERTLDSPTDKIMLSLTTFADELEREKARQRTYDAMQRKARAGHVTGGRVFGYDNVEISGANGTRAYETDGGKRSRRHALRASGCACPRLTSRSSPPFEDRTSEQGIATLERELSGLEAEIVSPG